MIPRMIRSAMFLFLAAVGASAQNAQLKSQVEAVFPDAQALYLDLHQHPELSSHETRTASVMAEKLRGLGYEVTENVGGAGVVAIMKNGAGPTVMLRTELDALPVTEDTGLPYASKVKTKDDSGREVGVMHACGHDVHMASLYGTAAIMAKSKDTWHGTLMLVGQPVCFFIVCCISYETEIQSNRGPYFRDMQIPVERGANARNLGRTQAKIF